VRLRTHTQTLWRLVSRARLQTKIMGISLAAIVLLGLALTWQVRSMMASALASELEARGYSVAKTLATRSTDLILTNDLYDLYAVTRDTVQSNQDVRYAFILDAQGRLLAHSFDDGFPPDLLEANGVRAEEPYHQQVLLSEEGLLQDIAVPVFGGRAGVDHPHQHRRHERHVRRRLGAEVGERHADHDRRCLGHLGQRRPGQRRGRLCLVLGRGRLRSARRGHVDQLAVLHHRH